MAIAEEIFRSDRRMRRVIRLATWGVSSMFSALAGPLGTFTAMDFTPRLFYWSGLIGVGMLLALGVRRATNAVLGRTSVLSELTGAAAIALTLGPAICLFNGLAMGMDVLNPEMLVHHVVVVFTVSLGVSLVRLHVRLAAPGQPTRPRHQQAPETAKPPAPARPAFLREIERETGGTLRWIEADDHYLRVHTTGGSCRVLMRFRDALRELEEVPGLRVHRSHWVALAAFRDVRRCGRRYVAVLSCGQEVPVSRAYLRDLEAARPLREGAA